MQKRINEEQIIEAPQTASALNKEFPLRFAAGDTTPSVRNLTRFVCRGEAISITQFDDGQDGQRIYVLGDGQTTVENNTNIVRSTGGVLTNERIYTFTRINGKWYESQESATGPTGPAGPAGPAGPPGADGADGVDGTDGTRPREIVSFSTGVIAPGVWAIGSLTAPPGGSVYKISANNSCGVRLYNTAAARDADVAAARPRTTLPTPGSGVLAETWLAASNSLQQLQSSVPKVYNGDDPVVELWYWAVMNTMLISVDVNVSLLVVPSEIL